MRCLVAVNAATLFGGAASGAAARCRNPYNQGLPHLRTSPTTGNIDPLSQARTVLALDINDIRVAPAAASDAVLLGGIVVIPVLVLLDALLLVERGLLEVGLAGQLAGGRVGGAMLDGGVAVTEVAEVVDVLGAEEGAGGEGVDWGVSPL